MDTPGQVVSKVLEAAQVLIELDGRPEPSINVQATADFSNEASEVQPIRQIFGVTALEGAFAWNHEIRTRKQDRLAVSIPLLSEIKRHRTVIIAGALLLVLGFGVGWLGVSNSNFLGAGGLDPAAPAALPSVKPSAASATSPPGAPSVRTVSQEVPIEGRALLDTIAVSESAYPGRDPYRVIYGGRTAENLADHPRQYVAIVTGPNVGQKTSAAGRYQYLGRSWDEARKALGLPDFSPESQDKAAFWEAQRTYRANTGRDLVADIQEANGDPQKLTAIGREISTWWTSLPGGIEPNKATGTFGDRFAQNLSYYSNPGRTGAPGYAAPDGAGPTKLASLPPLAPSAGPQTRPTAALNQPILANASHAIRAIPPENADTRKAGLAAATRTRRAHDRSAGGSQITNAVSLPKKLNTVSLAPTAVDRAKLSTRPVAVPDTRPTTIEGWTVRDVIGGTAVLEGPNGIRNVTRGDVVPGVGKIDSILRWGNRWIVATDRGLISTR
jgi:muramidase (phage lysozyme)